MQIIVNGKPAETSDNPTVIELLRELKVEAPEYVSVELNGEILDRQEFATRVVREGDKLEFLYFMGGGSRNSALRLPAYIAAAIRQKGAQRSRSLWD